MFNSDNTKSNHNSFVKIALEYLKSNNKIVFSKADLAANLPSLIKSKWSKKNHINDGHINFCIMTLPHKKYHEFNPLLSLFI